MKLKHSTLILFVLVVSVYAAQRSSSRVPPAAEQTLASATSNSGRYQLVSAQTRVWARTGESKEVTDLFLLDTQTGRVWRYQPPGSSHVEGQTNPVVIPEVFIPIEIWKTLEKSKTMPQE